MDIYKEITERIITEMEKGIALQKAHYKSEHQEHEELAEE